MNKIYTLLLSIILLSCVRPTKQAQFISKCEDNFDSAIVEARESNKLVLLYFSGPNCGWCEAENIVINDESIKKIINNKFVLARINVEKSELARSTKIKSVPTIMVLYPTKNGIEAVSSSVGYLEKEQFKRFLDNSVNKSNSFKGELNL